MKKLVIVVFSALMMFSMTSGSAQAQMAGNLIGTYEVSYIYNSMIGNDDDSPIEGALYGSLQEGVYATPVFVDLTPGSYQMKVVDGRQTGNDVIVDFFDGDLDAYWDSIVLPNNTEAIKYQTGFNGGNTNPLGTSGWWNGATYWIGTSVSQGDSGSIGSNAFDFTVGEGEDLWLYWVDGYNNDNLGGSTVGLWRTSESNAVPEPATMVLMGTGLLGMALRKRLV